MRPDDITIALLGRALILLRAYACEAKSIDRRITCHDIAEELAEAMAPGSALVADDELEELERAGQLGMFGGTG